MQSNRHGAEAEPEMAHLFRKYAPELLRYVCMHVATPEDAEDLVVEVFLSALKQAKFASLPESAQSSWLWRVARNKVIDGYRRAKTRRIVNLDAVAEDLVEKDTLSPEYDVLRQEDYQELYTHLQDLPPFQQAILRLRFGQDLTCVEIAMTLGKQENAVRVTLSRSLNRLRSIYRLSRGEAVT
ncbi:MAG: RNA polymerase sigma factor [Ktedonobacterales bacterium]